jgi:hypothetical protein
MQALSGLHFFIVIYIAINHLALLIIRLINHMINVVIDVNL